ncbi:MAG: hypothetical protein QY330_03595 [Candidatus Dojkabacteria bacterium]|uniref:Uncharacterized protein n=2 Tax=Candidatus Dojkabacteria TaxID=74243 RepID=A0A136KFY4_9BACT|nr:MAG: hypothetical protein UZ20_WS6002000855 [candidate division WS6 bacterium OLB21]MBW7953399.1 hypothetical protein [Candidatus Dojkabacteria bacterium]WKZ27604.1 MAG: hypothetical protein QY330_03595 [Candidatus Dojkabacteria bacterium]
MKKRVNIAKQLYIDIELTIAQLASIVFLFCAIFLLPVLIITNHDKETQQVGTTIATESEDANQAGRVAGISTDDESIINIPIVNIQFDTSLNSPDSIPILIGGIFVGISMLLFVVIFVDTMIRH